MIIKHVQRAGPVLWGLVLCLVVGTSAAPAQSINGLAMMPEPELILKHLDGWGGVVYGDQDGIVARSHALGFASVVALAARFLDKSPGSPIHALRQLGSGIGRRQAPRIDGGEQRERE